MKFYRMKDASECSAYEESEGSGGEENTTFEPDYFQLVGQALGRENFLQASGGQMTDEDGGEEEDGLNEEDFFFGDECLLIRLAQRGIKNVNKE